MCPCQPYDGMGGKKVQLHWFLTSALDGDKWSNSRYISLKGKGKLHPGTVHEGPQREYWYRSTLSLTSAPDGVGRQRQP